jgi:hypothetical protein
MWRGLEKHDFQLRDNFELRNFNTKLHASSLRCFIFVSVIIFIGKESFHHTTCWKVRGGAVV